MKKLRAIIMSMAIALGVVAVPVGVAYADAVGTIQGSVEDINDGNDASLQDGLKTIVNLMLFILGAIAVIMIIIGGIRYTTSNGDQGNIKSAKDIILYSVVGLVVAILAYAIVNFVLDAFSSNGGGS